MSWNGFDTAWLAAHSKRLEAGTRQKATRTRTHIYKHAFLLAFCAVFPYYACADSLRPAWNPDNQDRIYPNALFGISLWVGLYLSPVPTTPMPGRAFAFLHMAKPKTHIALYGGVGLKRGYCRRCFTTALVIDGIIQCCDSVYVLEARAIKRICNPSGSRHFSARAKKKILEEQDYRCAYCWKSFGEIVHRHGNPLSLQVNYDHQVPFAYVQETREYNILAACHVCNALKSDHVFQTIDECALFLIDRRADKGYDW